MTFSDHPNECPFSLLPPVRCPGCRVQKTNSILAQQLQRFIWKRLSTEWGFQYCFQWVSDFFLVIIWGWDGVDSQEGFKCGVESVDTLGGRYEDFEGATLPPTCHPTSPSLHHQQSCMATRAVTTLSPKLLWPFAQGCVHVAVMISCWRASPGRLSNLVAMRI